jgi:hypothetical protein
MDKGKNEVHIPLDGIGVEILGTPATTFDFSPR